MTPEVLAEVRALCPVLAQCDMDDARHYVLWSMSGWRLICRSENILTDVESDVLALPEHNIPICQVCRAHASRIWATVGGGGDARQWSHGRNPTKKQITREQLRAVLGRSAFT